MPPEPKFSELQAVTFDPQTEDSPWTEGIVIERRWEEAGVHEIHGTPHPARWIYEVQIGDPLDLFEIWFAEDQLRLR